MEKMTKVLSLLIILILAVSLFTAVDVDGRRISELQQEETDYILIEPEDDQEIEAGESITYTATAYDDDDEEIGDVTAETTWSIDEEAGGEWDQESGTYTSEYAGDWTVTATYTYDGEEFEDDVDLEVEEGPIDHIRVFPSEATVEAGDDIDYSAISYDEYGNRIENVTDDTDWSIDEEAGGDWDDNEYTSEYAGEWTVTGEYRPPGPTTFTDEALLTVILTDVEYVIIDPEEDQTVTVGEEMEFTAYAYDEYGNLITGDVTEFEWENIQYLDDEDNVAVFYQEDEGTYDVTATYDGEDSETTTVTVETEDVAEIIIEPEDEEIEAGESVSYTATAYDDDGEEIGDVTGETDWEIDEEAGGEWDQETGTYTSEYAGEWTVTATYTHDGEEFEDDVDLEVEEGSIDRIRVFPSEATIETGDEIDYAAIAYDEYGNRIENVTDDTDWSIDEEAGGEWDDNEYTSEHAGEWTVTGEYSPPGPESFEDEALLTVIQTDVEYVIIDPSEEQTVTAGETIEFSAEALDDEGNVIEDDDEEFTWEGTDSTGLFQESEVGEYTVSATYDGITSDTVTVNVEPEEVEEVMIESSEDQTIAVDETIEFTAYAYDEYGNLITEDITEFEWENINEIDEDGNVAIFYREETGEYEVRASYEGIEDTVTITVVASTPNSIEIEPEEVTILAGDSVSYQATAYDEFGNVYGDVTEETTWQIDEEAGGEWDQETGTYISEYVGEWTVTATYTHEENELVDDAELSVQEGEPQRIEIEPQSSTISVEESQNYTATAYDDEGNDFDVTYNVEWSIEEGADGSWSMNRYTSENTGTWNVYAEYSRDEIELADNATLTVEERNHTLTINHIGGGTTEPGEGDHNYQHGEEIELTAIPTKGWIFVEWTGDIEETSENITMTIESDMEIFATFEERSYFEVEMISPREDEEIEGDSITVRFNVRNEGIIEGSKNVIINIRGEDGNVLHTHEETVTLEPDQTYEGEFTWDIPEGRNFVLEIDSEDTYSELNFSVLGSQETELNVPSIWLFFTFLPLVIILLIGWVHLKKS